MAEHRTFEHFEQDELRIMLIGLDAAADRFQVSHRDALRLQVSAEADLWAKRMATAQGLAEQIRMELRERGYTA